MAASAERDDHRGSNAAARLSRRGVLGLALSAPWIASADAAQRRRLTIGGGPPGGVYLRVAAAIAAILRDASGVGECDGAERCGLAGLTARAMVSRGSVENMIDLRTGEVDMAVAQADVVAWAFRGQGPFGGEPPNQGVRALSSLFVDQIHVVARPQLSASGIAGLRRQRVALGEQGSGTYLAALAVLEASGLGEADVVPLYIPPADAMARVASGQIDAAFFVGAAPVPFVADALVGGSARVVPLSGEARQRLVRTHAFFSEVPIPAEAYGLVANVATVGVPVLLVGSTDIEEAAAEAILAELATPRGRAILARAHAGFTLRRPPSGAVPIHAGAPR